MWVLCITARRHTQCESLNKKTDMENKTEWYRKLLRKLNKIKSGELDLDEYIDEVKAKIEAES